jgi:DNA-binding NarL/FixJ family response regulator
MAFWGTPFPGKKISSPILLLRRWLNPPTGRCSRMPPTGPNSEELTWTWAFTTGHQDSDQRLAAAAKAAWSYSLLCAWTYLNDQDAAHELMDHAVHNASRYLTRHPDSPPDKLIARIKSVIRRRAKQLSARRSRELSSGSMLDLEKLLVGRLGAENIVYANELLSKLSPRAQSIVNRRWHGYSWREIAGELEMDHTAVRRAYLRELESLLQSLSRPGDSPK